MHPRMTGMWHHVGAGCGEGRCGGHGRHAGWSEERYHAGGDGGGGLGAAFGVRRPLRFLAWKLELDEAQVTGLAAILNELKTERAQAAVDDRRALTALADAVAGETFDAEAAGRAARQRVESTSRLQDAVAGALGRIHALLTSEQRSRLAYLIRAGAIAL